MNDPRIATELAAIHRSLDAIERSQRLLLRVKLNKAKRIPITSFRERLGNAARRRRASPEEAEG